MTEKSDIQKRQEAFNRLVKSTYENSKAKRQGRPKEEWLRYKQDTIDKFKKEYGYES